MRPTGVDAEHGAVTTHPGLAAHRRRSRAPGRGRPRLLPPAAVVRRRRAGRREEVDRREGPARVAGRPARGPLLAPWARRGARRSSRRRCRRSSTWCPTPDSAAARYEDKVRAHPDRYAAIQTVGGVAQGRRADRADDAAGPLRLSRCRASWHPVPDLPSPAHAPTCRRIPLPRPARREPARLGRAGSSTNSHYVWPVVLAFVLARAEIRRRRQQDEKRDQSREE